MFKRVSLFLFIGFIAIAIFGNEEGQQKQVAPERSERIQAQQGLPSEPKEIASKSSPANVDHIQKILELNLEQRRDAIARQRAESQEDKTPSPVVKQPDEAEPGRMMYVDASRLNVRSGAGKEFQVTWTLKRDEAVSVIEEAGDWRRVKSSRYDGWVYHSYLTEKPSPDKAGVTAYTNPTNKMSDAAIIKILMERSIAYYSGSCPCPQNRTRSGRRCGGNSAYSRPGGASPLCYPSDVTAKMISDYRAQN
ncbi:MAG: SH3 domain-containing protein [Pseudomonadota bacterium]